MIRLPEIWIAPQDGWSVEDFEDEQVTQIKSGHLNLFHILILSPDTGEERVTLSAGSNYPAAGQQEGFFTDPWEIAHESLRYYAADMWAYELGIGGGMYVMHSGMTYAVLGLEHEPGEYGSIGYATGYLVCVAVAKGAAVRVQPAEGMRRVLELARYGEPNTYRGTPTPELIGQRVHVRPHYQVPTSPLSRATVRSPWAVPGTVTSVGQYTAYVTIDRGYEGPWEPEGCFFPAELHRSDCTCAAYRGDGIHRPDGA